MSDFAVYLASLVASWEAFAAAASGSAVIRDSGYIAAYFTDPVMNNAVVTTPEGVMGAASLYGTHPHALWTNGADDELANSLRTAGYREDITTRPMLLTIGRGAGEQADPAQRVLRDVDPVRIAEMNGVAPDLVRGVRGLRGYASAGFESGLLALDLDTDVNISFVSTVPQARRRGLAGAVLATALLDAAERGLRTASLQATPIAESLYARMGFEPIGRWQEWLRGDGAG